MLEVRAVVTLGWGMGGLGGDLLGRGAADILLLDLSAGYVGVFSF